MYPKLYNSSDELLAVLDNIIKDSAEIKREVNGEFTFSFEAYEKELKSEYFASDNYVAIENQHFDLCYIEQTHNNSVVYRLQCEHVFYRLHDGVSNIYDSYIYTGTPTEILTDILSGTDFSIDTIDFTDSMTIQVNEEISKKDLIKELANTLGGELEFTNNGFDISILSAIGQNNGYQVRFGKNLQSVTKIVDSRGDTKTYYRVDCVALKNSNEYLRKGLSDLEVIELGDTIKVYDEVIGLDIDNRILSLRYNPIFQVNIEMEITNKIELISDTIDLIETSSVTKEAVYNGVKIGPDDGLFIERSDATAKALFNATYGISFFTDDGDGYEQTLGITVDGNLFLDGEIYMRPNSTGIANTDAGLLATLDEVDTTTIADDSISTPKLQANSVVTSKVLAGAITSGKIDVINLSVINADLGTITAGTLTAGVGSIVNIFAANIDIDEDVTIGQKLEILDPNNSVNGEVTAFEILTSSGLKDSLILSAGTTLNNVTGEYTVDAIEFLPIFSDATQFFGEIVVDETISSFEKVQLIRTSAEIGFLAYNIGEDLGAYLGLDVNESYQPGVLRLYNGVDGDSEERLRATVDVSEDSGYILTYRGDTVVNRMSSGSYGGFYENFRDDGEASVYVGPNSSRDAGMIMIYDDDATPTVDAVLYSDTYGGRLDLWSQGNIRTSLLNTALGAVMYMYNDDNELIVTMGTSASHGYISVHDDEGNTRGVLRCSSSVGDGRLDLYSAGGSQATISFNGSNLYVTIGGTSYQIDMTA